MLTNFLSRQTRWPLPNSCQRSRSERWDLDLWRTTEESSCGYKTETRTSWTLQAEGKSTTCQTWSSIPKRKHLRIFCIYWPATRKMKWQNKIFILSAGASYLQGWGWCKKQQQRQETADEGDSALTSWRNMFGWHHRPIKKVKTGA